MGNMITTLHRCVQVFSQGPEKAEWGKTTTCVAKAETKVSRTARETSCTAYSRKKWISASLRTSWPRDSVEGCSAPITSR